MSSEVGRIKPLDTTVINRIAAGEIIIGPSNALKEILENSIDAKSNSINVLAKEGGLKLLQITDNGIGIAKDDMEILCERFTTSKLSKFEDLDSIATYGFRGEALASISHISHLSVTTKTKDSQCAWRASYIDGKMQSSSDGKIEPKPVAGKNGTQITIEDLFYNVPSRLRAFRSPSDEYTKIVDVVGRYAIHCDSVSFSCKKFGEAHHSLITNASQSTQEKIRVIYGSAVASELIEINIKDNQKAKSLGLELAHGYMTNANYNAKKTTYPLFFINHRSVSCEPLKKALYNVYSTFLPKGTQPFIYLSLLISPSKIDVNVHPTKREVRFLNEEEIIQLVADVVVDSLMSVDTSRSFPTNSITLSNNTSDTYSSSQNTTTNQNNKRLYEYNLVRTDSKERKITSMFKSTGSQKSASQSSLNVSILSNKEIEINTDELDNNDSKENSESENETHSINDSDSIINIEKSDDNITLMDNYEIVHREKVPMRLFSIKKLRDEVKYKASRSLTNMFAEHTFIGVVDEYRRLATIQHKVNLYLVDYGNVSAELFYQIGLSEFGNFGTIKFLTPLSIRALLQIVVNNYRDIRVIPDETISNIDDLLYEKREMLKEYFSITINDNREIETLPLLLKNYTPFMGKLPVFIYRIGANVDWEDEKNCFNTFLRELSLFYVPESLPGEDETEDSKSNNPELIARRESIRFSIEHVIFPALKRRLIATENLSKDIIEITNLPGLYKVFERC